MTNTGFETLISKTVRGQTKKNINRDFERRVFSFKRRDLLEPMALLITSMESSDQPTLQDPRRSRSRVVSE